MKKNLSFFAITCLISLLLFSTSFTISMSSQNADALLEEAKLLLNADAQYLDARLKNKWKIIYSFQHPDYQKKISIEEFKYFNGHIAINYREDKFFQRISGAPAYPSVEKIKKNPFRNAPFFDIPIPPTYRLMKRPTEHVRGHKLENVYIDDSVTFGKVTIRLNIVEAFPPAFRMIDSEMKYDIVYVDYWKKVNDKWVLALMRPFPETKPHISGSKEKRYEHPIPMDKSRWDKVQFTGFKVEELK